MSDITETKPLHDGRPYAPLEGGTRLIGTIALSTAVFMNVLDTSIANVAIPTIAGNLGVSSSQGTWVITSFAVANAITVPLTGWLTKTLGEVRLFIISTLLFVLASWMCGFAWSLESLVFFRVIQGAVAGPMIPISQSLMLASYPKAQAGSALAIWAVTTLVAPILGPVLGGYISDNYSWSWIFYINVPIGLLAAFLSWSIYKDRESKRLKLPVDKIGLILMIIGVGALQLMFDKGKELDWFSSGTIQLLAAVSLIALTLFIIWELTDKHPIVDLSLFKNRNFTAGTICVSIAFSIYFGTVVLIPLWLQSTLAFTATEAGKMMAPVGIFAIILSPIVGKMMGKHDARLIVTFAFIVFAIVCFMRTRFNTEADIYTIMLPTLIQGIATACFFIPLTTISLSNITPDKIAAAAGLSNFIRLIFGALGTSIFTTMWEDRAVLHHSQLVEATKVGEPAFDHLNNILQHANLSTPQVASIIDGLINKQAYTISVIDISYLSAFLFLLLIPLVWFSKRVRVSKESADASAAAGGH